MSCAYLCRYLSGIANRLRQRFILPVDVVAPCSFSGMHLTSKPYRYAPADMPWYLVDFACALSNPIAYQSELERHAQQLEALTKGFDVGSELIEMVVSVGWLRIALKR